MSFLKKVSFNFLVFISTMLLVPGNMSGRVLSAVDSLRRTNLEPVSLSLTWEGIGVQGEERQDYFLEDLASVLGNDQRRDRGLKLDKS